MITQEKIAIYNYFNGDIDGWVRIGTEEQKLVMDDNDWFLIEKFIQNIQLIKNGNSSEAYTKRIEEELKEECDNEATAIQLKRIAYNSL